MLTKGFILACALVLLSIQLVTVHSTTPELFDTPKLKLQFNLLKARLEREWKGYVKSIETSGKFVLQPPGKWDYAFLSYDVAVLLKEYYYDKKLSDIEFCKKLFGVGMGFGGSLVGAPTGSYIGTMITPGVGTFVGGLAGGYLGYEIGRKIGSDIVGDFICLKVV